MRFCTIEEHGVFINPLNLSYFVNLYISLELMYSFHKLRARKMKFWLKYFNEHRILRLSMLRQVSINNR